MFRSSIVLSTWAAVAVLFAIPSLAVAENEGLEDLDRALEAKADANSYRDLTEVAELCDSAIDKGLTAGHQKFAETLLGATLYQRAKFLTKVIMERRKTDPRWPQYRTVALGDLERAVKYLPEMIDAHMQIGKLQRLQQGDRERAFKAFTVVVKADNTSVETRAEAYSLRAPLNKEEKDVLADYARAIELAPKNMEVIRERGVYHLSKDKVDEAIADFDRAIEIAPGDAGAYEARGLALFVKRDYEEAVKSFDKAIAIAPDVASPYMNRGRAYAILKKYDKAIESLNQALLKNPGSLTALELRARVHQQNGDTERALADAAAAARLRPGTLGPLLLRVEILASAERMDEALEQMERLVELVPDNVELMTRLGVFYMVAKRPRAAIDLFTQVLEKNKDNWLVLRRRGDAHLSVAQQAEAIADYEKAIKLQPKDEGLLNNLAWVLATSPDEKVRDGKRAVELATRACEESKYEKGYILSTLAAAYAETNDFEQAKKWSTEAVKLGSEDQKEQLAQELESYNQGKAWRELQDVSEGGKPKEEKKPTGDAPARTADF